MDNYVEQIVRKYSTTADKLKKAAIIIGGILLVLGMLMFVLAGWSFLVIIVACVIYFMWLLLRLSKVEYEYIVTNNEIDIDKIMGQRSRKRLITLKLNQAEAFGEYTDDVQSSAEVTVAAHDCSGENLWYVTVPHKKHGRTMLLFTPNERVLLTVNRAVPTAIKHRDLTLKMNELLRAEADNERKAIDAVLHPFAKSEEEKSE